MTIKMSESEREAFLAGVHVGVLSVAVPGRAPLTTPVWYRYTPGGPVTVATSGSAPKARAIAAAGRFSLCAQDEAPPYKYVAVEGPAVVEPADDTERLAIACRYLGAEEGAAFMRDNPGEDNVAIRMTPEHWNATDFGKAGG